MIFILLFYFWFIVFLTKDAKKCEKMRKNKNDFVYLVYFYYLLSKESNNSILSYFK